MHYVCKLNELQEGQTRGFKLTDKSVFALIWKGELKIYLNSCPHRFVNLEWEKDKFLDYEGIFIQCSVHGALFRIDDGFCIAGPCPGQSLTALPYRIEEGSIYLI